MDLHFIFESNDDNVVFKYRFLLIYFLKNLNTIFLFFSVSTYRAHKTFAGKGNGGEGGRWKRPLGAEAVSAERQTLPKRKGRAAGPSGRNTSVPVQRAERHVQHWGGPEK